MKGETLDVKGKKVISSQETFHFSLLTFHEVVL